VKEYINAVYLWIGNILCMMGIHDYRVKCIKQGRYVVFNNTFICTRCDKEIFYTLPFTTFTVDEQKDE